MPENSQLNCLGLSAFLARCSREQWPFVLLDDPVMASDEEHKTTFVRFVIEALINQNIQTIITTHDDKLKELINDYYKHLPLDSFSVVMPDHTGAIIDKTSSKIAQLLADARPFLKNQVPEVRKIAAGKLRDAAERLCKEIIVKERRAQEDSCTITDYDGKILGELIGIVEPFLTDPSHPGKLQAIRRILNPGAHDAPVPASSELVVANGDILRFKKDYLN